MRRWLLLTLVAVTLLPVHAASAVQSGVPLAFRRFAGQDFGSGTFDGTELHADAVRLADGRAEGTWTSPPIDPGFAFGRLVPSWNADAPVSTSLQVDVRGVTAEGRLTAWYVLGIWTDGDESLRRTSVNDQTDADARVATDTLLALVAFSASQVRVTLRRESPEHPTPALRMLGVAVSTIPGPAFEGASAPGVASGLELPVPAYSQEIHARQYTAWGGGGEAWCSPTSTEMIVEYWGRGPSANDLSWVDPQYVDPSVDFAARHTFDLAYHGTGNWPFNTAYAARFGLEAFVTQLRSLAEAEQFVQAGIPLAASIKVAPNGLDGFLFPGGTNGHLVVLVGFTESGDPIVNDPAAPDDASVRRVYDRAQLERAWLNGSAGTVYVIHPSDLPLPVSSETTPHW